MLKTLAIATICLWASLSLANPAADMLFDSHIHYNAGDAAQFSHGEILAKLKRNGIGQAIVTSTPADHAAALYRHAPQHIVPLLGVYRQHEDKSTWSQDRALPARLDSELDRGHWQGIGELHLFAKDRHSPVFQQIIAIAARRKLPLLLHADPAVIDSVYDIAPGQAVAWAHAGTYPYPDLLADYLQRYPALYIDLSVRDGRIAPGGKLADEWYELFLRFPDRFMIGVDTYSLSRWQEIDSVVATIRNWLDQLPDDVARKLAHDNAAAFYTRTPRKQAH